MGNRTVTFEWDDTLGDCYECGKPVAMQVVYPDPIKPMDVCSVCAANHACDGETVRWHPERAEVDTTTCGYCGTSVTYDGFYWLDGSGGDCCWGDWLGNNDGNPHNPWP